ncbi:protein FAM177A1 [Microcaecilia unicolor]|uniref:Protein FAM177A1 n=1 Tax=Microcaecilia unicolor TaxID=1415580 RepID=A0A6P7YS89_9AMPH|nr:protein FAM177A1 [Microcaecilia unicolor]
METCPPQQERSLQEPKRCLLTDAEQPDFQDYELESVHILPTPTPTPSKIASDSNSMIPTPQLCWKLQSDGAKEFENVELGIVGKMKKIPRRIIHFASGETMEEYSTDEEEEQEKRDLLPSVDPTKLTWGPYVWFYMLRAATSTLSVCDFLGERIASFLGISTPKYQYAIDEYYRMKKEEEEEEEENKMSEEAERRYQEQNKTQEGDSVETVQPEVMTSFVNINFEIKGDAQPTVKH